MQAPWGREHLAGTSLCIASQTKPLISGPRCYHNETVGLWCVKKLTGWNMQPKKMEHFKGGNFIPTLLLDTNNFGGDTTDVLIHESC